ncbi:hypothetical protein COLO4_16989 [Corchorus olitorius]|uniref:Uncharacterized protein n=1 Tax=Corchorus olitorius TaxID=93759 RepID=A0A1R3JEM9_9ROSI|nr:hypothetical protein COLO4_16989 [Corchorus olitorius]
MVTTSRLDPSASMESSDKDGRCCACRRFLSTILIRPSRNGRGRIVFIAVTNISDAFAVIALIAVVNH